MTRSALRPAPRLRDERGSTIPLIIAFFIVSGLMLVAGVVASAAFLAQRELQAGCDGAAVAAADGLDRSSSLSNGYLSFDEQAASAAVGSYLAQTWGNEAGSVGFDVGIADGRVIVQCRKIAHVPFEDVFSPGGILQTVEAAADAPLIG